MADVEARTEGLRSFEFTRGEIGLLIDGVAGLVDPAHQEASPLLKRLQEAYGGVCKCERPQVGPGIYPHCLACDWRIGG